MGEAVTPWGVKVGMEEAKGVELGEFDPPPPTTKGVGVEEWERLGVTVLPPHTSARAGEEDWVAVGPRGVGVGRSGVREEVGEARRVLGGLGVLEAPRVALEDPVAKCVAGEESEGEEDGEGEGAATCCAQRRAAQGQRRIAPPVAPAPGTRCSHAPMMEDMFLLPAKRVAPVSLRVARSMVA